MKKVHLLIAAALALALVAGCKNDMKKAEKSDSATPAAQTESAEAGINGKVAETMDAAGYTYVQVDTGKDKVWVASQQTAVKVGDEISVPGGSVMTNFESKTLNRTFDRIIFAPSIMVGGADKPLSTAPAPETMPQAQNVPTPTPTAEVDLSGITKPKDGKTVEEIFTDRQALNGKNVVLRGKVVKFLSGIMGKNWIHVKDGTGKEGTNDLVVTTQAQAKIGDLVMVKGKVAADKDFGSGYRYDVIVEDANVTVE